MICGVWYVGGKDGLLVLGLKPLSTNMSLLSIPVSDACLLPTRALTVNSIDQFRLSERGVVSRCLDVQNP